MAPSVNTGGELGVGIVKRLNGRCPLDLDCEYWFVYWPLK